MLSALLGSFAAEEIITYVRDLEDQPSGERRIHRFQCRKFFESVFFRKSEAFHQVPGGIVGAADISCFTLLSQIIQGANGYLMRGFGIKTMSLIDINIVSTEPFEAGFTGFDNLLPGRFAQLLIQATSPGRASMGA